MKYATKLGDKICEATATTSIGLRHICKQLQVPYSTITSWIYDQQHELHNKYMHAKQMQLFHLTEEILEIADDSTNDYMEVIRNGKTMIVQNREAISRSRLRIQARMNILTKLAPIIHYKKQVHEADFAKIFQPRSLTPEQQAGLDDYMAQRGTEEKNYGTSNDYIGQYATPPAPSERAGERSTPASSPKKGLKTLPNGNIEWYENGYRMEKHVSVIPEDGTRWRHHGGGVRF